MESYSLRNMYLIVSVMDLHYFIVGAVLVWTSPMILYLRPVLLVATELEAAITSACPLGMVFGPLLGLALIKRFGQVSVMWLSLGLTFCSLAFLSLLPSVLGICVGRFIAGLAIGAITSHMPQYIGEISEPEVLAVMSPITSAAPCLGYLVVYTTGLILNYHQLFLVYLPVLLLLLVCQLWVPPSPQHCVSKGQVDQAKQIIACLKRGISTNAVDIEIQHIQTKIARSESLTVKEVQASISEPATKNALLLSFYLVGLTQLSGVPTLLVVLEPTLLYTKESRATSLICIAVSILLASMVSPSFTAYCGLRKSHVTSFTVMACSMSVLGLYLLNLESKMNVSMMSWVPSVCLLVHLSAFHLGMNTDAIVGKLIKTQFHTVGLTISATAGNFLAFICAVAYFPLNDYMGPSVVVWIFAVSCFIAATFMYLCVPETSTMTPTQIHNFLVGQEGLSLGASLCKVAVCR